MDDLLIGRYILKDFPEGLFRGKVEKFHDGYYFVVYSDGDSEDLSKREVKKFLEREPLPWQLGKARNKGTVASEWIPKKVIFGKRSKIELNFLSSIFQDRVTVFNFSGDHPDEASLSFDGKDYALVTEKIPENMNNKFMPWYSKGDGKGSNFWYVATAGPGLPSLYLQDELEKIANFGALPDFKRYSRLSILVKDFPKAPIAMKSNEFELVDDLLSDEGAAMGDGCGFFPEGMFSADAVQFRCIGPRIGVHKGMLCRKQGITKIQLMKSTQKVGPSLFCNDDWVALGIVRETPSTDNKQLAKVHSGKSPSRSFRQRPLSPMITNLMSFLKVPKSIIYQMESSQYRNYAWLTGLADPTSVQSIPAGKVVIPGCTIPISHVFITRSPCVLPEDARLLPVVTSKPKAMKQKDWAFLQSFRFGCIIFSTAGEGTPLPLTCADGDLDGDKYFVCFDKKVVKSVKVRPWPTKDSLSVSHSCASVALTSSHRTTSSNASSPCATSSKTSTPCATSRKTVPTACAAVMDAAPAVLPQSLTRKRKRCDAAHWLAGHQRFLLDNDFIGPTRLIGKIYREMETVGKSSKAGMDDPEYRLLACAYKESIDTIKHRNDICLPPHLRRRVGLKVD